jgi:hypothetical protein
MLFKNLITICIILGAVGCYKLIKAIKEEHEQLITDDAVREAQNIINSKQINHG